MNIQLIYNPNAGGRRGEKIAPIVINTLRELGHTVIDYRTLYRNHATEIARHFDLNSCDAVVSAGGDGTAYEVLNGLMRNTSTDTLPPFGIVPVGTGNSFSKDLGMQNWRDGVIALNRGVLKSADIMKFITEGEAYYSMNCIGFGLPADVCITGNKYKKVLGKSVYTVCAVGEIMRFKPYLMRLEVDGEMHEMYAALTNFSNSTLFGGNMKISPNSIIDDGLIEVIVLENASKKEIIKAFPTIYSGEHLSNPHIKVFQGKHFKVETDPPKICNPEGEIFGVTPLEISVLPKAVKFFMKETR